MNITKIRLLPTPLFTIITHAYQFANSKLPKSEWVEVLGLLGGKSRGASVTITNAYPVSQGTISKASMKDETFSVFETIHQELEKQGLWIVGWYHSHPGHGLFLSSTDQQTQKSFQLMNPKAVALVIETSCLTAQKDYLGAFQLKLLQETVQGVVPIPIKLVRPKIDEVVDYLVSSIESDCKTKEN